MKRLTILLITLISCSNQNKTSGTNSATDTVNQHTQKDSTNSKSGASEVDCVFNNDYKGLTESWLEELKITNYIWRPDLEQALIPRGQDTVFLSQGGCVHFGILAEIKLANDNHPLTDSSFFITKALQLATEFKMDHYEKMIRERKIKKSRDSETPVSVWYVVEDNDPEDNLYYNGIEITADGKNKKISLTQYLN